MLSLLTSCVSTKKVTYFENKDEINTALSKTLYDAKIMPKDILKIQAFSMTPGIVDPFNLLKSTQAQSATSSTTNQEGTVYDYLVDNDGNIDMPIIGYGVYLVDPSVTERCVLEMRRDVSPEDVLAGEPLLELTEVAPGIDVKTQVLDQIGFDVRVSPQLKKMDPRIFTDEPMVRLSVMEDKNAGVEWNGIITGTDRQSELWNRPEGSKANLVIYTNCDEVELVLNGKSLGRRDNPKDAKSRNKITWNGIGYKKGRLEAVGYRGGKAVARHALETTGKPVKIVAEPDNSQWHADGMDLQHIRLRAVDAKGRTVLTYQDELTFSVSGDAQIVAVTNGDINSHELNVTNHRSLWQGQAMVILRAGTTPSTITLTTKSKTLKPVTTKLQTKN